MEIAAGWVFVILLKKTGLQWSVDQIMLPSIWAQTNGGNAQLHLETQGGRASIHLEADLGHLWKLWAPPHVQEAYQQPWYHGVHPWYGGPTAKENYAIPSEIATREGISFGRFNSPLPSSSPMSFLPPLLAPPTLPALQASPTTPSPLCIVVCPSSSPQTVHGWVTPITTRRRRWPLSRGTLSSHLTPVGSPHYIWGISVQVFTTRTDSGVMLRWLKDNISDIVLWVLIFCIIFVMFLPYKMLFNSNIRIIQCGDS